MDEKKFKIEEEKKEFDYVGQEMNIFEEFEDDYKRLYRERNESEEMYMISTILTSDF